MTSFLKSADADASWTRDPAKRFVTDSHVLCLAGSLK